ncbi:MAG TPA: response regulator transcription factor [Vicinamibacterales bacterium]|jgi:DNA-binding NarL/FixJ family response regulator|nr:response regulator transcription factor [Vicinamibacterales bacterium]
MRTAKVLIADDHASLLSGLVSLLEEKFEVVGAVVNGYLLVEAAARLRPDVVVTDISMPGLNGLEALEQLKAARPDIKVIVLTMYADAALAAEAIRAGASGFVVKVSAADELETAINEVLQGRVYLSPDVPRDVVHSS